MWKVDFIIFFIDQPVTKVIKTNGLDIQIIYKKK